MILQHSKYPGSLSSRKCEESSILRVALVEVMYLFSRVCAYIFIENCSWFAMLTLVSGVQQSNSVIGKGGMSWGIGLDIHTLPCVKQLLANLLYSTPDPGALWWPRGGGWGWGREAQRERGREYRYIYSRVTSLYSRNWHNIIKHYTPIKKEYIVCVCMYTHNYI